MIGSSGSGRRVFPRVPVPAAPLAAAVLAALAPVAVPAMEPLGDEFRVNRNATGTQDEAAVATNADGDFVVVWQGPDGGGSGIFFRRFDADGVSLSRDLPVNSVTSGTQVLPSIAMDADGAFVVAWTDFSGQDGDGGGVYARRFDASGNPEGVEFPVAAALR